MVNLSQDQSVRAQNGTVLVKDEKRRWHILTLCYELRRCSLLAMALCQLLNGCRSGHATRYPGPWRCYAWRLRTLSDLPRAVGRMAHSDEAAGCGASNL